MSARQFGHFFQTTKTTQPRPQVSLAALPFGRAKQASRERASEGTRKGPFLCPSRLRRSLAQIGELARRLRFPRSTVQYDSSIWQIIIRSKFFFLLIGWEPTTWPANNCLQIMVCSCAMPSNCLAANNILHMRKGNRAFLLLAIALAWKWQIASLPEDIR